MFGQGQALARPARVADGRGAAVGQGRGQHGGKFGLAARGHDHEVRDMAQIGEVERAVVGGSVLADQAGAVEAEGHGQVLQADVVHDLVVGTLEKGRVDRDHGLEALHGEAGGEGHGVLLADAHVHEALGHVLGEIRQSRALGHGRGDGHDALIGLGQGRQRLAEHLRVARRAHARLFHEPGLGLETAHAVKIGGVVLGRSVTAPLLGQHVDEDRPVDLLDFLEDLNQPRRVVAVDGAQVVETEGLEQHAGREKTFKRLLAPTHVTHEVAAVGQGADPALHVLFQPFDPALVELAA
ncbi:hypothetical protein DSECCO2_654340 [anaerobic digester metagenome]